MKLYRIADWAKHYEVSDSRKVDGPLSWVPVRTKTDGFGYLRITQQKDRSDMLAAWYLMLGIAAKQPKGQRGALARNGVPLTPDDMELMTRFPAAVFAKALLFFSDAKQGWLTSEEFGSNPDQSGRNPDESGQVPNTSESTPPTGQDITEQNITGQRAPDSSGPVLPFESEAFAAAWTLFEKHRREIKKPLTPTASAMSLKQLAEIGEARAIACIEHTIRKGWQGLREDDSPSRAPARQSEFSKAF